MQKIMEMKTDTMQENCTALINETKPKLDYSLSFFRKIRKNIGAFLEYLWELSGSIRLYKADAVIITGKERQTGQSIKAFYFGHYDNYAFIFEIMFSQFEIVERYKSINSIFVKKWITKYQNDVDLLFIDVELLFCKMLVKDTFIASPQWIRQKFEIPDTWEEVLRKFRKNTRKTDLRKIRKYRINYRLTKSDKEFRDFYHHMYVRYLRTRFGNAVIIEPEGKVIRQCRKGELMQIIRDDQVVGCVLLHKQEGRLAYVWIGVPDTIRGDMLKGVFSAMYYYTILYGYQNGCTEVDFLGTRPLLNDGLFRYKRKWGTYIEDSPVPRGYMLIKPLKFIDSIRSFFKINSFIVKHGNKLSGRILFDDKKVNKNDLENMVKIYETPGLEYLKVFSILGFDHSAWEWAKKAEVKIKLIDLSESSNKARDFCSF